MSDDDRRLGAYAPPPDDYDTFDARDADQDRRGWLFLAAAVAVFVLFAAVVYNTFQLGVRERSDSPVIAADTEPFRVAPDDDADGELSLGVHDLRSGEREAGDETAPGETRPVSEEPVALPEVRVETADADEVGAGQAELPAERAAPAIDEPVAPPPERSDEPAAETAPNASIEDVIAARERERDDEAAGQPESQAPARAEPTSEPAGAPQPFLAQIAAFRSEADAESDWRRFARAFPDLASGRNADIQRADLGDRGIYYRLRINGFSTREAANEYCQALQSRGQACLVARR